MVLLAGLAFLLTVGAQEAPAVTVKQVLDTRARAVEARDLDGVRRSYSQSPDMVVFRPGAAYRGWNEYRAYWERALPGVPDGFRIDWHDDVVVHVASNEIIVASLTWSTDGGGSRAQQGRITVVLRREGGRFVIAHEHLSGS